MQIIRIKGYEFNEKNARLLFWTLFTLIAFLTLLEIFSLPSSTDKVWLFGLSVQRFMIALFL